MGEEEPEDHRIVPVLCDDCSRRALAGWLGVVKLQGFDCMICHRLVCAHLREPEGLNVCVDCI